MGWNGRWNAATSPTATRLRDWLADVLAHGSGRNDAILLRHAHRADGDCAAARCDLAAAIAPSRERRAETLDQGTRLHRCRRAPGIRRDLPRARRLSGRGRRARRRATASTEDATAAAYLQAFAANLISAAVRLVPLGQSAGLRVLAALEPVILQVAGRHRAPPRWTTSAAARFRSDLAAMRHETQYTRLFRS